MENYDLYEILSDISYIAGECNFFTGDSRQDISEFIRWAHEFHEAYDKANWGEIDYIETIHQFTLKKISIAFELVQNNFT